MQRKTTQYADQPILEIVFRSFVQSEAQGPKFSLDLFQTFTAWKLAKVYESLLHFKANFIIQFQAH